MRLCSLLTLAIAAASLSFGGAPTDAIACKINEYEGQHFALAGDPSQWGLAGDPSKW